MVKTEENSAMTECKNCRKIDSEIILFECESCGATICEDCAIKTQKICPYCYSTLDFKL